MLNLAARRSYPVGLPLFLALLVGLCGPCLAAPTVEDAAPPKNVEQPAGEGAENGAAEAPEEGATPKPTVDPKAAEEACKKAVATLGSGDVSSVEALPESERMALLTGPTGVRVLTCLAIAKDDKSRCDLLEGDAKKACLDQWQVGRELKNVPKEKMKGQLLYRTCASNSGGANCNLLREAVDSGNADKCNGLEDAARRAFCAAVASGDVKKCNAVPEGPQRAYCAAFTTDDASHCPKDIPDCIAMARGFAALKKGGGLEGFQDIDATIAAASVGTKACNALLSELEKSCGGDE
jgi:hypothetical protein